MGDEGKFDAFIGEKLKRPFAAAFGRRGTREADQMGFGASIENTGGRWRQAFFAVEGGFEPFFDEAFSKVGDGICVAMKVFGDLVIGNTTMFGLIDGKQNIRVFDLRGTACALGNELRECVTLLGSQGDLIKLLHGNILVAGDKGRSEGYKIRQGRERAISIKLEWTGY
jgi:hypothetical protein